MSQSNEAETQTEVIQQPELFREFEDILNTPKYYYPPTGREVQSDLRERLKKQLALGCSMRRLCEVYRVGPMTIAALRDKWIADGSLQPIRAKQLGRLDRITDELLAQYEDDLYSGSILPRDKPIHFGVLADKRAQLAGDAQVVVEHRHTVQISHDQAKAWVASLASPESKADSGKLRDTSEIDVESAQVDDISDDSGAQGGAGVAI